MCIKCPLGGEKFKVKMHEGLLPLVLTVSVDAPGMAIGWRLRPAILRRSSPLTPRMTVKVRLVPGVVVTVSGA